MADFDNTKLDTSDVLSDVGISFSLDKQSVDYIQSPLVTNHDTELLNISNLSIPVTQRRPSYLQYIDYV